MSQRECPYALSMSQSFERLVGAVVYGSDLCNWVKYSGQRYFHQGHQGKSDGTLVHGDEVKMEVECKVVDCSKRTEEEALKTLFSPRYRTYDFLDKWKNDDSPLLRVLVIGLHNEDKMKAWKKLDPSIYSFIVVAYMGRNFSDVEKIVRRYDDFDGFAEDLWEASDEEDYFSRLNGTDEIKKHIALYDQGKLELLQGRIFKRLTALHPKWIYERLALDAMIEEQIEVGLSQPIQNKRAIMEGKGLTVSRNLVSHYEGQEWIVNNGETGKHKRYFVQIKKIINDIWDGGHKAKTEAFVYKYGLPA
jgi:hypothetical protein